MASALDLSIPNERTALPKDFELRPRKVKAWIESLPLSQCAESGQQILANLRAMNRAPLDFDARLKLLEIYRPVSRVVLDELDAIYGSAPLRLPPKSRAEFALAREIAKESAFGYKILVVDRARQLLAFKGGKRMALLVFRAMESLVQQLRASYRAYTSVPEGVWREIHALYLYAANNRIADDCADPDGEASVADLYGETLLIALTDPYRLVPGDFERIENVVREKRGAFTLGQARPPTQLDAHFLVPCDQDRPPKPLLSAHDDPGGPNWRILDASPIVERLRARRKAVSAGEVSAAMSKANDASMLALLGKVVTLWGDPPKRTSRRHPMDSSVAICAGLPAVTHFVSIEPAMDAGIDAEAFASATTIPLIAVPDDEVSASMNVGRWDVVNQSSGGLKVRRVGEVAHDVIIGEVLGIKSIGNVRWAIGVVRWITIVGEDEIEIGIQFLAPAARLVAVQPTSSATGQVRAGLILSDDEGLAASDVLLTPNATYSDLREFEIEGDGIITRVRSTNLIERTSRFELFHFTPS